MTAGLNLNTTMYCNALCPFCIVLDRLNRPELNMTDEQIDTALVQARAEGATHAGYDRCAVSNLCARLDSSYEKFHGRPKLTPFASRAELDSVFDAARVAYPGRATHLGRIRERYMHDRDSARPERVMTEPVAPHPGTAVKLTIPRAPKAAD